MKNIINSLFTRYSREILDKAANFSLRDFVSVLKKQMKEFENSKDKKNIIKIFRNFSERREIDDELQQTFINRTMGNNYQKAFFLIDK